MQVALTFTGLEELVRKCAGPPMIHWGPMKAALTKSALDLERESKALTPRVTGNLQRSITHRIDTAPMPLWAEVGLLGGGPASKTGQRYGVYVHEGTRAHVIKPKRGKFLYWPGARHPVRSVRHPGTRAQPFLRNALTKLSAAIAGNLAAAARAIEAAWGR